MKNSTVIDALFKWFDKCPVLNSDKPIGVDHLGENAEQYSIEVVPTSPIIKAYPDGSSKNQYLFIFASRNYYGEDNQLNMDNLKFYEQLEKWIEKQNYIDNLPQLPDGYTPQSVTVLSSGYNVDNDAQTARYQIQCRLKYIKEINYG